MNQQGWRVLTHSGAEMNRCIRVSYQRGLGGAMRNVLSDSEHNEQLRSDRRRMSPTMPIIFLSHALLDAC